MERWKALVSRYEKRKDDSGRRKKVDDDVKMSALEMLVPADLENHLVLNRYRLKGFEDAWLEVEKILEARTGSRLKEVSIQRSAGGGFDDPMQVDALSWKGGGKGGKGGKGGGKGGRPPGKGQPARGPGGAAGKGAKFDGECRHCGKYGHKAADCWSKAAGAPAAKAAGRPAPAAPRGGPKGGPKGGRPKGGKGKRQYGANSLEQDGGWQPEAEEHEAGSLQMGCFCDGDSSLCAMALAEPGEYTKFGLDSGAAISAFPLSFLPASAPGQAGNGRNYRTASGALLADKGGVKLTMKDENGLERQMPGRLADVHKPLVSQGKVADAGQQTWLTAEGGYLMHKSTPLAKKIQSMVEREAATNRGMLPVYREGGVYNFYMKLKDKDSIAPLDQPELGKQEMVKIVEQLATSKLGSELAKVLLKFQEQLSGNTRQPQA
jgi:hypothetical protein